jgi:hypothetical protein
MARASYLLLVELDHRLQIGMMVKHVGELASATQVTEAP